MATAPRAVPKPPAKGAPQEAPPPPAAAKKSGMKMVVIALVVLLLLGGGGGAAWYFMGSHEAPAAEGEAGEGGAAASAPKAAAKGKEASAAPVFMVIEPFTVNLQPDGAATEQFLQVAFSLQVSNQQEVDLLKLYMPQVRSRLLLLLSGKKASEINTPEGKKKLADEIVAQVKLPFSKGVAAEQVSNVFFTSFVIQ